MKEIRIVIAGVLLLACLVGLSCAQQVNQTTNMTNATGMNETTVPSINVTDQAVAGDGVVGNVTVDQVVSNGSGWLVIHNNLFGHPGGVIGYTEVESGMTENVTVTIHTFVATDQLFAVLHRDAGMEAVFEYPVPDTEQMADGQIVIRPFNVTAENATLMNLTEQCGMVMNQTANQTENQTTNQT
ncbi:hypothetical protein FGU65_13800 [Methanoculleus sp. FWC-SCC1]|uniref:DUF7282 domain-containing protein n=1 Tax=Methanoculleus frigidifontis TaxID=2584085 RepID=A0ABT8MDC3_9EURY|nr:hypothetical protein [Methanoculleus sp. FWC-SCC1]MDN7025944.1 hypothetical protein [Methanoculleus sp. FWC-SCC1]